MACRTIRNERERRTSAMLATYMPCGAKLPVIALFAGAFFSDAAQKMMVFGAIVEIHVPTHRNEKHQKRHQKGSYLQNAFFHAAKIIKQFDFGCFRRGF